jgi:hypothetical protein
VDFGFLCVIHQAVREDTMAVVESLTRRKGVEKKVIRREDSDVSLVTVGELS